MSDTEDTVEKPAVSRRRKVLLLGLVGAGGFAVTAIALHYVMGVSQVFGGPEPEEAARAEADAQQEAMTNAQETVVVVPLREIIVNIAATTASGRQTQRFLKLNLALVYDTAAPGAERLDEREPYIRDAFIDYLRLLSERDLRGSAGLARLRAELLHRARSLAGTDAPREVLVVDMVIQ